MPNKPGTSDHLVIFGITGDLGYKMTLPSLYRLERRGMLPCPVLGVAFDDYTTEKLVERARNAVTDALNAQGEEIDEQVFSAFANKLTFIQGDFTDAGLYQRIAAELKGAKAPLFYLEIPPSLFAAVVENCAAAGMAEGARFAIEKPFGTDLASAIELNNRLLKVITEEQMFRIDHFLGKEPVQDIVYLRFANALFEPVWNRHHVDCIEITMSESFGVEDRGSFYDKVGALRDVVQNHLLQVLALVMMEPPGAGLDPIGENRLDVFEAMRPADPKRVVRGQYAGYQNITGVAPGSDTETFIALRLEVDSWRWAGVPIYIRAGKRMPVTATEVVVRLKRTPGVRIGERLVRPPGHDEIVFRIGGHSGVDIGVRVKTPGENLTEPTWLSVHFDETLGELPTPYERLLHDALNGDHSLFPNWPSVEATWRVVQPILDNPPPVIEYAPDSWGPDDALLMPQRHGGWKLPHAMEEL